MSGSNITVSAGETLSGQKFDSPDFVTVQKGGTLQASSLLAGTTLRVDSGGSANNIALRGGTMRDNGSAHAVTVTSSGYLLLSGGFAGHTTLRDGTMDVANGVADHTFVGSGGTLFPVAGSISGTTIGFGGTVFADAYSYRTVVSSGGLFVNLNFSSDGNQGLAKIVTVAGGGEAVTGVGDDMLGLTIDSGGILNFGGGVISGVVHSGGTVLLEGEFYPSVFGSEPYQLEGLTIDGGGTLALIGGATEIGATIAAHAKIVSAAAALISAVGAAQQLVAAKNDFTAITVSATGTLLAYSGATLGDVTVTSGGIETLYGGNAHANTISAGGHQIVGGYFGSRVAAGTANNTTIASGGLQTVSGVGTADNTIIQFGGSQTVYGGGIVSNVTVESGGLTAEYTLSGGTFTEIKLEAGGSIVLGFAYAPGATATLGSNDVLTLSAGGQTTSLQMSGSYHGETFHLAATSTGDTLITLSAAAPASAAAVATSEFIPNGGTATHASPAHPALPMPAAASPRPDTDLFAHLLPHIL